MFLLKKYPFLFDYKAYTPIIGHDQSGKQPIFESNLKVAYRLGVSFVIILYAHKYDVTWCVSV